MNGLLLISLILAISLSYCSYYNNKMTESRIQNDQAVLQNKKAEYEQLKAACQFPDGYVRTGSGYWFNLNKFTDDVMQYRKSYRNELNKSYYDALTRYMKFKIINDECQLQYLSKPSLWDGKKLLNIEDVIKGFDKQSKSMESAYAYPILLKTQNSSAIRISICYTKECSGEPLLKPKHTVTVSIPVDKTCKYRAVEFPITKYPDLVIRFTDCDIKNGQVKNIFRLSTRFIYTGINNFGYPYEFHCDGLVDDFEGKTVPLQDVLNTFDPTGKRWCQNAINHTYPDNQLYFYGGRYSLTFNTYVLASLGQLIHQSTAYATKYISKEKKE